MKDLITQIQAELEEYLPEALDVFIATDEQVIPMGSRFPCVGIKDGSVATKGKTCGVIETTLQVRIVCWTPSGKGGAQVTGDATQPGVLALAARVVDILENNLLDIEGMISAENTSSTPSKMYINDQKKSVQQKVLLLEYIREEKA